MNDPKGGQEIWHETLSEKCLTRMKMKGLKDILTFKCFQPHTFPTQFFLMFRTEFVFRLKAQILVVVIWTEMKRQYTYFVFQLYQNVTKDCYLRQI